MKYIKILLIALTFCFVGVATISPVYAEETTNGFFNDTEEIGLDFCTEPSVKRVLRFAGYFLQIIRYVVPFLLVVQGTFIFFKAVTSDADTELKKSAYAFGRKVAIGILVFFVPAILDAIFGLFSLFGSVEKDYKDCKDCLLHPGTKACDVENVSSTYEDAVLGDDGYSRNCSIVGMSECKKYKNCDLKASGFGQPTCGPKDGAKQYAENCALKGITECASKYYNCKLVQTGNSAPICTSNGLYH